MTIDISGVGEPPVGGGKRTTTTTTAALPFKIWPKYARGIFGGGLPLTL